MSWTYVSATAYKMVYPFSRAYHDHNREVLLFLSTLKLLSTHWAIFRDALVLVAATTRMESPAPLTTCAGRKCSTVHPRCTSLEDLALPAITKHYQYYGSAPYYYWY